MMKTLLPNNWLRDRTRLLVLCLAVGTCSVSHAQTLLITAPKDGTTVRAGDLLNGEIAASAGASFPEGLFVFSDMKMGTIGPVYGPPYRFAHHIAANIPLDTYYLTAQGLTSSGVLVTSMPVSIRVGPAGAVTPLRATPELIVMDRACQQVSLSVEGVDGSGALVFLERSGEVMFTTSDAGVANVDVSGVVTAAGAGTANISVVYGAWTAKVAVVVGGTSSQRCVPEITALKATPDRLWPPNGQMIAVSIYAEADGGGLLTTECKIVDVKSNEVMTTQDWRIVDALTVELRARRSGGGVGRVYNVDVACENEAGMTASGRVVVLVPHDRRGG